MENEEYNEKNNLDNSLRLLAKYSFIVFMGIFLSKVLSFLFRIIIARYMHSEFYGSFSLAMAITECLATVFGLGLSAGILRYVSIYHAKNEPSKINHIIRITLKTVLFSSILGMIFLLVFSKFISINIFHNPLLNLFLIFFSFVIPILIFGGIFMSIIQAYEEIKWASFINNILYNSVELIVIVIVLLIFIYLRLDQNVYSLAVIISYIAGSITLLISSYLFCKYKFPGIFKKTKLDKKVKSTLNKELFSYSWPLTFIGIITFIFGWTDSLLLGYYKNVSSVGVYNVAIPIASLISMIPLLFLYLLLPLITREYSRKNYNTVKETTKQVGKWIFMLNLPILIIIILFPGAIINFLQFGSEYYGAIWPIRFLAIGLFFNSIFLVSDRLLAMVGKSKVVLFNLILSSIINVLLNILLIPIPKIFGLDNSGGLIGASIATMITYIFWSFFTMFTAKKYSGITPLRKKMIHIFVSAIISTILLLIIKQFMPINLLSIIIELCFFILIYFSLILITNSLDIHDLMIIKTIKDKILPKKKE